jgi:hypothetical protein
MKFAVEAWASEYGSAMEDAGALATPESPPDVNVEVPAERWAPRRPPPGPPADAVLFTDGVRRIDARVWIDDGDGGARLGVCASYAAGIVRTEGPRAWVTAIDVQRGLFTAASGAETVTTRHGRYTVRAAAAEGPDQLALAVQQRMGELEVELALASQACTGTGELIVVDGPLRGRQQVDNAIGYVKTHHVAYLPPLVEGVVGLLSAGERTPLFLTTTSWSRYSWYLRLPGPIGHPWAGVVRCEASADLEPAAAVALADLATSTLPRFASQGHKDPRAPQNLYPIAGLERALRHRLGDPQLLYRALRLAAA